MAMDIGSTTSFRPGAVCTATPASQGITAQTQAAVNGGDQAPSSASVANARLGDMWHQTASSSSYNTLFGNQSYVKDGSDPQLLSMLQAALAKAPELQSTALAQHVNAGKVGPEDVKELQSFLESKGFSVGGPGIDGKYGPLTHGALENFLNGVPPGGKRPDAHRADSHRPDDRRHDSDRDARAQREQAETVEV